MLGAGVAWNVYSLHGHGSVDPTGVTAGNFLRAAPLALVAAALWTGGASPDPAGLGYAFASGAIAPGLGCAVWYAASRSCSGSPLLGAWCSRTAGLDRVRAIGAAARNAAMSRNGSATVADRLAEVVATGGGAQPCTATRRRAPRPSRTWG